MAITVKRGDTGEGWEFPLTNSDGTPADLTGNTGILLKAKRDTLPPPAGYEITGSCTVSGAPTGGVVQYAPLAGDVDTPGVYVYEVQVTTPAGTRTFTDSAPYIVVEADL